MTGNDASKQWIVIPNWSRFQHYNDRDPTWIKDYVSQLGDDDWLNLSLTDRGALQTLRLLYALSDGKLPYSRAAQALGARGVHVHTILVRLNHAGLIAFSASRPLALARSREKSSEEKKEDRASAQDQNPPRARSEANTNGRGEPETIGREITDEGLRLARQWLADHGVDYQSPPKPDPAPDDDLPFPVLP